MRVFELHFNPKKKTDAIFDSFVYEPGSQEESRLGNLYMAGELNRVLPQNYSFLDNLSDVIKNGFYERGDFSEALKSGNNFLEKESKSGNVNWLGNINFAVLNIGDSILNFTKVGNVKILLLRGEEVLDISQNLELQDQEPYPMKVFSNIASGKLLAQDKIIILTNEVFQTISQNEIFLNQLNAAVSERDIQNIFKSNKNVFLETSGLCLLITEVNEPNAKNKQANFGSIRFPIPKMIPAKIILIICFILILAIAYFLFGNKKEAESLPYFEKNLQDARAKILMAENFIIIKKNEKAQALFQEAWDILQPINTKEASSLRESIKEYIILAPQ